MRLSSRHDIADRRAAGRRLTHGAFGVADEELSVRANPRAFRRWRFQPRTPVDVSGTDTSAGVPRLGGEGPTRGHPAIQSPRSAGLRA